MDDSLTVLVLTRPNGDGFDVVMFKGKRVHPDGERFWASIEANVGPDCRWISARGSYLYDTSDVAAIPER